MTFRNSAVLVFALAQLAGCATDPVSRLPPEQAVARLSDARWEALLGERWEDAYRMLTPGFRSTVSLETFISEMKNRRVAWQSAAPSSVTCDGPEKCTAKVKIEYSLIGGMPGVREVTARSTVSEIWLRLEGRWYHLPSKGAN